MLEGIMIYKKKQTEQAVQCPDCATNVIAKPRLMVPAIMPPG